MPEPRTAALVVATVTTGLIAGLFYAYACSVMPGLGRADDRTFVEAMRRINVAILNGWFALCFAGAPLACGAAALLHLGGGGRPVLPWTVAAFALYAVVLVVTFRVNVPLNDALAAAGAVDRGADLAAVRERFEARWVRWNTVRAVAATASFGCLVWALVLHGRLVQGGGG
ncbi:DUF1772 domain-containing protein [Streptomyces macrosporus]|uniref:DUF1772 domain-containing protein n=1 Tax=Streptomyces macrosporus TaxID=44032 RepID=A0ABN3JRI0_9ACTN